MECLNFLEKQKDNCQNNKITSLDIWEDFSTASFRVARVVDLTFALGNFLEREKRDLEFALKLKDLATDLANSFENMVHIIFFNFLIAEELFNQQYTYSDFKLPDSQACSLQNYNPSIDSEYVKTNEEPYWPSNPIFKDIEALVLILPPHKYNRITDYLSHKYGEDRVGSIEQDLMSCSEVRKILGLADEVINEDCKVSRLINAVKYNYTCEKGHYLNENSSKDLKELGILPSQQFSNLSYSAFIQNHFPQA